MTKAQILEAIKALPADEQIAINQASSEGLLEPLTERYNSIVAKYEEDIAEAAKSIRAIKADWKPLGLDDRMLSYITGNPGKTAEEIKTGMNLERKPGLSLKRLVDDGKVSEKGGKYTAK